MRKSTLILLILTIFTLGSISGYVAAKHEETMAETPECSGVAARAYEICLSFVDSRGETRSLCLDDKILGEHCSQCLEDLFSQSWGSL